jgi:hypothetical protein
LHWDVFAPTIFGVGLAKPLLVLIPLFDCSIEFRGLKK